MVLTVSYFPTLSSRGTASVHSAATKTTAICVLESRALLACASMILPSLPPACVGLAVGGRTADATWRF